MAVKQKAIHVEGPQQVDMVAGAATVRTVKTTPATLSANESGAICYFTTAAGQLYTLPPCAPGLVFEFYVQTTATSGVHRIACATGDFLKGTVLQGTDSTFTQAAVTANGSTHLAWEGNGSTTGGILGDSIRVQGQDDTIWQISGVNTATGTEATPFKTS